MHSELKVLVPHGVEGVAVDGFGAEVAAIDGHAQDVHLDAGAAGAVTGTDVLSRDDLREDRRAVTYVLHIIYTSSFFLFFYTKSFMR